MLQELRRRENLYIIPLMGILLDWGSTIAVTMLRGEFAEVNPIARAMGFEGAVVYAIGFMAAMSIILFRWGIRFADRGDRLTTLTDWLAIAVALQGIGAYLNNIELLAIADSVTGLQAFTGVTVLLAASASILINRRILLPANPHAVRS